MDASTMSYVLRLTATYCGFASTTSGIIQSRALPNYIDSGGASFTVALLRPANM